VSKTFEELQSVSWDFQGKSFLGPLRSFNLISFLGPLKEFFFRTFEELNEVSWEPVIDSQLMTFERIFLELVINLVTKRR